MDERPSYRSNTIRHINHCSGDIHPGYSANRNHTPTYLDCHCYPDSAVTNAHTDCRTHHACSAYCDSAAQQHGYLPTAPQ